MKALLGALFLLLRMAGCEVGTPTYEELNLGPADEHPLKTSLKIMLDSGYSFYEPTLPGDFSPQPSNYVIAGLMGLEAFDAAWDVAAQATTPHQLAEGFLGVATLADALGEEELAGRAWSRVVLGMLLAELEVRTLHPPPIDRKERTRWIVGRTSFLERIAKGLSNTPFREATMLSTGLWWRTVTEGPAHIAQKELVKLAAIYSNAGMSEQAEATFRRWKSSEVAEQAERLLRAKETGKTGHCSFIFVGSYLIEEALAAGRRDWADEMVEMGTCDACTHPGFWTSACMKKRVRGLTLLGDVDGALAGLRFIEDARDRLVEMSKLVGELVRAGRIDEAVALVDRAEALLPGVKPLDLPNSIRRIVSAWTLLEQCDRIPVLLEKYGKAVGQEGFPEDTAYFNRTGRRAMVACGEEENLLEMLGEMEDIEDAIPRLMIVGVEMVLQEQQVSEKGREILRGYLTRHANELQRSVADPGSF